MVKILEKVERRLGEKLFIKGDRCLGPKCVTVRRAYPPGVHGKRRTRRREGTGYGLLLAEKQKLRFLYGLDDREIARYSNKASTKKGIYASNILQMLEARFDNIVFRLGLADSRRSGRQLITHGHVLVNGKVVHIPSYTVRKGDVISLKERILKSPLYAHFNERIKKYEPPQWLILDKVKKTGTLKDAPYADDWGLTIDVAKIKEFYSR